MNCEPANAMEAARCYQCVPEGMLVAIRLYLLCQWARLRLGAG